LLFEGDVMMGFFDVLMGKKKATPPPAIIGSPYVVCETYAAITTHLRELKLSPLKYSGGLSIKTLCGMDAAWDTKLPVETVRCSGCVRAANARQG
jgi:hypothetical protein